ncbi:unnamed protein product [Thlaspi arvense]|uniref:GBF-interacting protein 1 N-terminal domain-containing protein n=1 Tax=Thlaspi arvense TaxID=13288 RepID=A0AAU9R497_THLAR|nr:unnamed protein product [Thlaspi arvense]
MNSFADGGSSRVSIPHHLRKTLQSIREITGKQHSDEDIFAVYKESFNDPYETAQKLRFLDTFHEVKSKREKKKEASVLFVMNTLFANIVPITQESGRSGRRNSASSNTYHDARNGRNFKRGSRANRVTGASRTSIPATNKARDLTVPHAIKVSAPTSLPSGVNNHKLQDDCTVTVNKGHAEKNPLSKSSSSSEDGVEPHMSKAISEPVAAPVSVPIVQNHIQDVTSAQVSEPLVNSQPAELQSSTFSRQDPSLISASHCTTQSDQVTKNEPASNKSKGQLLLKSDVGERSHVTFPFHLQVAEVLQNGLTFGSFDSSLLREASSNNGASGGDDSNFESSHGTGDDEGDSSPATNGIPGVGSPREGAFSYFEDGISNSAPGAELVRNSDPIVPPVEGELEQALSNTQTHQIAYGREAPFTVFGLVPSMTALGQPPGNSNAPAISLVSYPPDQGSIAAASQQATQLFRQQYPPNFFPYSPYYPPFYMPSPYIHQFLSPNGIPQQSYFPPGAALAAPTHITPVDDTENPPTTNPSPHASLTVDTHIPSATTLNSNHTEERTSPMTESAAAWIGQGLGNLQVNPMYNLALQGQPLGFPVVQAGHSGIIGMHHPSQPMTAASATYQTLPPPPQSTRAMAEPTGHPHIAYQQPQAALTNWDNNH